MLGLPTPERTAFDLFAPDGAHIQRPEVPHQVQRNISRSADPGFLIADGFFVAVVVDSDGNDRIQVWRVVGD